MKAVLAVLEDAPGHWGVPQKIKADAIAVPAQHPGVVHPSQTRAFCTLPNYTGKHMKPSQALAAHRNAIRHIVEFHCASNARVFGSVAKGTDTEGSDLDILIDPAPGITLFDIGAIRYKLRTLLGVEVDVLTPNALPASFRAQVISEAVPI